MSDYVAASLGLGPQVPPPVDQVFPAQPAPITTPEATIAPLTSQAEPAPLPADQGGLVDTSA